jgi:hypothetical protein
MFSVGRPLAYGLFVSFLFRIVVLNAPAMSIFGTKIGSVVPTEVAAGMDYSIKQYSTLPGPDLNIPMVKESEENLKEQLLKCVKHPLPLLIFTFCLTLIFSVTSFLAWSRLSVRSRASRLYLTVSILRI